MHRFLMVPPKHYRIDYVINPWMGGNVGRVDANRALEQWNNLHDELKSRGRVDVMPMAEFQADHTFVANAGLVHDQKVILSQFRHAERRGEEEANRLWFEKNGFEIVDLPRGTFFEGAADALFDRGSSRLWMGYGYRTSLPASEALSKELGIEVIPLRLVDERFFHLDLCFCPLAGGYLIYFAGAFDERGNRLIEEAFPAERRFAVSDADALQFACNAVDAGGVILLSDCTPELENVLGGWGFKVVRCPLGEFSMAGAGARSLTLRLDEHALHIVASPQAGSTISRRVVEMEGHLLDTGLISELYDLIEEGGGMFETLKFKVGAQHEDKSFVRLAVSAPTPRQLDDILAQLIDRGVRLEDHEATPAAVQKVVKKGVAPDDFYGTTIYPTEVLVGGQWLRAQGQRMDGVIVLDRKTQPPTPRVALIRDLIVGDDVVVGVEGIRIHPKTEVLEDPAEFKFMSAGVSSERRVEIAVDAIAWELDRIKDRGGRVVVVAGPVTIHTGGGPYLAQLIRQGYVQAVLAGNALAVHDIEYALYGTSLGVDLKRGITVHGGHRHHLSAINTIRRCGGIRQAVEQGVLKSGLFHAIVKAGVPYALAGSIRDDGPLPDTEMDLIRAQAEYGRLLKGADMILMLSSMLHSIGVGNMTPSGVKMVCVDISPSVATKLADRGSVDSLGVVTDVGLFLNLLVRKLQEIQLRPE